MTFMMRKTLPGLEPATCQKNIKQKQKQKTPLNDEKYNEIKMLNLLLLQHQMV